MKKRIKHAFTILFANTARTVFLNFRMNRNLYPFLLVLLLSFSASVFGQQTSGSMADEPNPLRPMKPLEMPDQKNKGLSAIVTDNTIRFTIADQAQNVKVILVNMQGQSTVLADQNFGSGEQQIDLNQGHTYASGVYILDLVTQTEKTTLKLMNVGGNFLPGIATKKESAFESFSKESVVYSNKPSKAISTSRTATNRDFSDNLPVFFQANTTGLFRWKSSTGSQDLKLGMAPLTSPAIVVSSDGTETAFFQANTSGLWKWNSETGAQDLKLGMMAGTSPTAVASVAGIDVFFQANTTGLWKWNSQTGAQELGFGIMKGTSPAAVVVGNEVYVYFQANTGELWQYNAKTGGIKLGLGMMGGTSPVPVVTPNGEIEVFFQANTTALWKWNTKVGGVDLRLGMMKGTSPTAVATENNIDVFFQANTTGLWRWNSNTGGQDLKLGMMKGTSPAAVSTPNGIDVFFQANTAGLWRWNSNTGGQDLRLGMAVGTSPAVNNTRVVGAMYTLYPSAYDAVQAAVGQVWYKSINESLEYGGVVYKIKGTNYYGFVTIQGKKHEIDVNAYYPTNSDIIAYWHTHPNRESRTASPADIINLFGNGANKGIGLYTVVFRSGESRNTPRITSIKVEAQGYLESGPATPEAYAAAAAAQATVLFQDPRDNKTYGVTLKDATNSAAYSATIGIINFTYSQNVGQPGNTFYGGIGPVSIGSDNTLNFTGGGIMPIAPPFGPAGYVTGSINFNALLVGDWKGVLNGGYQVGGGVGATFFGLGFGGAFTGGTTYNLKEEGPGNNWGEIVGR